MDSAEISLKLIREYKKHEILWRPGHPHYYNKLYKEEAWSDLLSKFNQYTIEELKRKMDSLKGSYRREKARIRKSTREKGDAGRYVSRWFAFESLKFLDEQNTSINASELYEDNIACNAGSWDSEYITVKEEIVPSSECVEETEDIPNEFEVEKKTTIKRKLPATDDSNSEDMYNYPQQVCDAVISKRDQCSLFGEYVVEKIRSFDARLRAIAQHRISNVLFELEMTTFKTPNDNGFQQIEKEN